MADVPTLTASGMIEQHRAFRVPRVCRLLGLEWDVLPDVYAPDLTRCAALYAEWLTYDAGSSFCELGCGTGYLAVTAALRGCTPVHAADINITAVRNARLNAVRHGVSKIVSTSSGDMFAALAGGARYDTIFWNSSFIDAPSGALPASDLERAFFDPDYAAHASFLRGAREHLAPGGRLILGFASLGNRERLQALATQNAWSLRVERAVITETAYGSIRYELIRFEPVADQ
jgi:release factor glutamine methyltransferase